MKMKNGFLKKISQEMKTVSWEIFFISSMFSAEIDMKTGNAKALITELQAKCLIYRNNATPFDVPLF
jgi:hypothetical protein